MKKEFKAPIVENKEFTAESVMAEMSILSQSTGQARQGVALKDETAISEGYNIWKGFSK